MQMLLETYDNNALIITNIKVYKFVRIISLYSAL